jgi:dihydroflavonol-4-reductase
MILVTGATGHIGNVLIRNLLDKGEKVRALVWHDEDTTSIKDLDVEQVNGDVLDRDSLSPAMSGVDSVFHLAGIISILPGKNPSLWKVNVEGTRNVLKAALRAGVRRLIYTSSIHAIARAPHGVAMDETLGFDKSNPYGEYDRSKAAASLEVQEAVADGMDAVIACPTGVIGPYDFRGSEMGEVIRSASEARTMFFVEGAYDFVDVRDVADGLIAAHEHGRRGESYILGGSKISVRFLLESVREVTGKAFASIKIPLPFAKFASNFTPWYYLKTRAKPRFTPYSLEVLQSNSNISHAKAARELGFHPRPIHETITDTVRWFFENRRLGREIIPGWI